MKSLISNGLRNLIYVLAWIKTYNSGEEKNTDKTLHMETPEYAMT